jgi:acyl-CoA reductase-like NAD-dependent aldehyde dehydrogenase
MARTARSYPVVNPARPDEVVHQAPWMTVDDLDRIVARARIAFPGWAATPLDERVAAVQRAAAAVASAVRERDLARLLTREHGKILIESIFDTASVPAITDRDCGIAAEALTGSRLAGSEPGTAVTHEPYGVVAIVLPFNWPVALLATKVVPALLAGNAVIVKPPPTCPGAVLAALDAMVACLPEGVLGAVNAPGAELGEALVRHRGVDMVSLTGGIATGRAVMTAAASELKPVVLELGGNDPAILAPDVEVDEEIAGRLLDAAFVTSGQVCLAVKRLYVPRERLAAVIDALVARCAQSTAGDGLIQGVTVGPVHTARARDFVEGLLAEAQARGTRVHRPGQVREEDVAAGAYLVAPAIVESPPPDAGIVVEEQFGPALPVIGYRDLDDAVAQANDTRFGLCASIWSDDADLAASVAARLEVGTVFVNGHGPAAVDSRAPFGGWKQSGIGLEWGVDGIRAFTRPRVVVTRSLRHARPG